jgi:hypothetical protein
MKKYITFITLLLTVFANSQDVGTIQKEIDQNLWKPFKQAFEDLDAEKLNALYAEAVLRVTPNGIDTENSFKGANVERLNGHMKSDTTLELDFWFDSRHTNETTSYEVGFYRMSLTNENGTDLIYGQFHIVLKKMDGIWEITQDWDTSSINGKELTKEDFEKQKPMHF